MRPNNLLALNAVDASQSTQASAPISALQLYSISAQAVLAGGGSNVGTVKIQGSNDSPAGNVAPTQWNDITGAVVTFSGNGTMLIGKTDLCYNWVRVLFAHSGGTGANTLSVRVQTIGF